MANVIKIYVETPDEILDPLHSGAGAVVQLQRDTVEAFTTPADVTTEAIVSEVRAYTIFDPAGDSSSWYRTRYETSGGVATSDWSTPFQVGIVGYCTLDDVKQRLQRTGDETDDELFAEYIDEATDYIRGYIGHDLIETDTELLLDGAAAIHGGRCLLVPRGVRSLTVFETAPATGAAFTTQTLTDLLLRPSAHERSPGWPATELWLSDTGSLSTFPRGYDNVRLTGTFGFGAVPGRVQEVALNLVVRMYASRQAGQSDMLGAGGDGGQPMVSSFLSRRDRETLDKFTPMLVA